jgi:hypothetical protein
MPKEESLAELSGRTQELVKRYSLNPFKTRFLVAIP